MKAINYKCFKLEEKTTRRVKTNKNNFTNVIADIFPMSISFCKKLFGCKIFS